MSRTTSVPTIANVNGIQTSGGPYLVQTTALISASLERDVRPEIGGITGPVPTP